MMVQGPIHFKYAPKVALDYHVSGSLTPYFREAVLLKVVRFKRPLRALWNDPIAIIQRQALANVNDPFGIVVAQIQGFEYLIHKGRFAQGSLPSTPISPPDYSCHT